MGNKEIDKEKVIEIENIFLSLEQEYVAQLLQIPDFLEYVRDYFKYSNRELMAMFINMQEQMDNGEVKEEDENNIELSMIACVLAMSEKIKQLILVKTPVVQDEEELGHGRSHARGN